MKKLLQLIGFMIIATSCSSKKGNDNNPEVSVVSVNPPSAVLEIISTINSGPISFSLNSDADTEEISLYLDDHCSTLIKTIAGSDLKNQVTVTVQENQNTKIYGKAKKNNVESSCTLTTTVKYWPSDTFNATYATTHSLSVCDGTQNFTENLTSCIGQNTAVSDNSKCAATSSVPSYSPAGNKTVSISGGTRYDTCAVGSSTVSSSSFNCNAGYIYANSACNKIPTIDTNGYIATTVLDSVNNIIYVGGMFNTVNGVSRKSVAALDATTGEVISGFNANVYGATEEVSKLILVGSNLYIGGEFMYLNSVGNSMRDVAVVDSATGAQVVGFNNTGLTNAVRDMIYDSGYLYVIGNMYTFTGGPVIGLIKINASTGAIDHSYNIGNSISGGGSSIMKFGNKLYIGGHFDQVSGQARTAVAAIDLATGVLDSTFNPSISSVNSLLITSLANDGTSVYITGVFDHVSSQLTNGIAKLDAVTGAKDPNFSSPDFDYNTTKVSYISDRLFVGGAFNNVNSIPKVGLVELDPTTGGLLSYDTGSALSQMSGGNLTNCYVNDIMKVGNLLMVSHDNCSFDNNFFSYTDGSVLTSGSN